MAATDTLTDKVIKTAQVAGKPKRISDGGGLYLEARPTGAGWWRCATGAAGRREC